jgi:hypothetical protein
VGQKRELATEAEYDEYVANEIESRGMYDSEQFVIDFVQKIELKEKGIRLSFYKEEGRVYYEFRMDNPNS